MPSDDTQKLLNVRARFGLMTQESVNAHPDRAEMLRAAGETLSAALAPGNTALITGPSGSGKTLALRAFTASSGAIAAAPVSTAARRAPINLIRGKLDAVLETLAACGLGEARRLITPAGVLSDGERARLALARAIAQSRRRQEHRDIACDEFTSTLDRLTARSVCHCIRRALTPNQRFVCATAHDDVVPHLDPDIVLFTPLVGPPEMLRREDRRADSAHSCVA